MLARRSLAAVLLASAASACTKTNIQECVDSGDCEFVSGTCTLNPATGNHWCSFADNTCPSGSRWADILTGDDLAGSCVEGPPQPDAALPDADIPCVQRVGFGSKRNGPDNDIFVANLDGSNQVDLTANGTDDESPVWSPNGDRVAYSRLNAGDSSIWVMNADGTDQHPITMDSPDLLPVWSHQATRLAFMRLGPAFHIWVIDAAGGIPIEISGLGTFTDSWPSWSPDDSKIAFVSNRDGDLEIWVMDSDGGGQMSLTTDAASVDSMEATPQWSPDGTLVSFVGDANGSVGNIWVVGADGSDPRNLSQSTSRDTWPRWLPDGRIVFTRYAGLVPSVWIMNGDGSGQMSIADPGQEPQPSSDGTEIVFKSDRDGNFEIYRVALDGSGPVRFTNDPAEDRLARFVGCN